MKGCRPTAIDQKRTTANTVFTYSIRVISLASLSSVADITPPAAVAGRGNGIALSALLDARRIWKGQSAVPAGASLPTGHARLDALLPGGGWPEHALSEILHARDGVGELQLLMPTLARLTQAQRRVVLVGAPTALSAGLAGRRGRPAPPGPAAGQRTRRLVGCRTVPALGQLRRSAVLAAAGRRPRPAPPPGRRRKRSGPGFRLSPPARSGQPFAGSATPVHRNPPPRLRILKCRGGLAPATALPASAWQ